MIREYFLVCDRMSDHILLVYQETATLPPNWRKRVLENEVRLTGIFVKTLEDLVRSGDLPCRRRRSLELIAHNITVLGHMWTFRRWYLTRHYTIVDYIKLQTDFILGKLTGSQPPRALRGGIMSQANEPYKPQHHIRAVTATSLFDGHDAAINIVRRILQGTSVEVIHLGHNRSVNEIVAAAIDEDVQGIAVSSYQGGHLEYFKYMVDLLKERDASHIKVFGGGGGVIIPEEIKELEAYGVTKIYSPEDGNKWGLQGIINHMVELLDFSTVAGSDLNLDGLDPKNKVLVGRLITAVELAKAGESADLTVLVDQLQKKASSLKYL